MSPDGHGTTATAFSEGKKPDPKGHPVYDCMYVTSRISHSCMDLESALAWSFGPREELTPVDKSVGAWMVWWGVSAFVKTQRAAHGKKGVEGQRGGAAGRRLFYRAKLVDLLSLRLLFADFVVLYYCFLYVPAFGLTLFLDSVLSR